MELLTRIKELARGKKAAVLNGYAEFVRAVATGQKIDTAKAADAVDAAGKTAEDFEADVEALVERLRLRAVADKQAAAEKQLESARAKIAAIEKKLADTVAAIREEAAPVHEQVRRAEAEISAATQAEGELRRTYPTTGPARAELAEAETRAAKLDAERHEIGERIKMVTATIAALTATIATRRQTATTGGTADNPTDSTNLANAEKRLATYRDELAAANAERDSAVAAMNAATTRMTQP